MTGPRRAAAHRARQARLKARSRAAKGSPTRQIGAAADHLRAVVARLPADQAQQAANDAVTFLVTLAERYAREGDLTP